MKNNVIAYERHDPVLTKTNVISVKTCSNEEETKLFFSKKEKKNIFLFSFFFIHVESC